MNRTQAYDAFRLSGSTADWQIYQHQRKAAHQLVKQAKKAWLQQRTEAITQAYDDRINDDSVLGEKDMWQLIRALCPKHVADTVFNAVRHPDGGTATSAAEITDAFKCHYQQLGSHAAFSTANGDFDQAFQHEVQCNVLMHLLESHDHDGVSALDAQFTAAEIQDSLAHLKTNKAGNPQEQGIVNELLKYGGAAMTDMLLAYCNLLWKLETVHMCPVPSSACPKLVTSATAATTGASHSSAYSTSYTPVSSTADSSSLQKGSVLPHNAGDHVLRQQQQQQQ